ncbi:hypothetical protein HPK02_13130 [Anoxybacillus flavithermus]|uniref:hypothetical protein n=1 Tax=Anoxybacillus flavithermus TaxID=33934 RepID=UPI0018666269|nr:hypothetical protein [Anoxybacillus flavithermus]MBE2919737.1 hypothetical protein [Anoxybacillus flavithermus]
MDTLSDHIKYTTRKIDAFLENYTIGTLVIENGQAFLQLEIGELIQLNDSFIIEYLSGQQIQLNDKYAGKQIVIRKAVA